MSSSFGNLLKVSVFGQSHGAAIGVVMDGLPAGEVIDQEALSAFLERRKPGKSPLSTPRREADAPVFLSGLEGGVTCGAPLCAVIQNGDQRSGDYSRLAAAPRPGHADYTAFVKWGGQADMRGGGHFSGRLTAPLCVAGGIAKQILARRGVFVGAHIQKIAHLCDQSFPLLPTAELFEAIAKKDFPVINDRCGEAMQKEILAVKKAGDSVGGIIQCAAIGLPPGLGEPMFGGVENRLAAALFGIPAVKGVEFGAGFSAAGLHGSEDNDPFVMQNGEVRTESNHAGGILGGITTGMPVTLQVAVKPTPSIARPQRTVDLTAMENTQLTIQGRHDPCIAHRAVPVVEAVTAVALLDLLLEGNHGTF